MLKKIAGLGLFLTVILASCTPSSNTGADGYQFGEAQFEKTSIQVNVVTYQTKAQFDDAAKKYGVASEELAAFSVLRPPFDQCTIHMIDPRTKYQPEFTGHELLHCVYGQWHTNNNSRS
jgi:hypothetical protein